MTGEALGGSYPVASIGPAASSAAGVAPAKVVLAASGVTAGSATGPVRRKRGRPRDPLADGRILSAASSLILLRGFDAMTVDEVAATAGVGKATVYRRWSKKEDLAVAAMERLYSDEMPVPDTGTLRGDLAEVYRGQLSFAQSPAGADYMRTLVRESMRDDRMAALYRTAHEQAERNAREIFHRAAQRGEIERETPVDLVVSLLSGLVVLSTVMGRDAPSSLEVDRLVDLVLRGLGGRAGDSPDLRSGQAG
jgi:AcrR family transcriptional regulator